MIKFEHTEVVGWEHVIRGMRNPMNSWEKNDSFVCDYDCSGCPQHDIDLWPETECKGYFGEGDFVIGRNDHDLMMRLAKGGPVHAKYRRMITVYVDLTAPLYWWKEFDTYKVGTVANSCSTMHKIAAKEFTLEDFSCEHLISDWNGDNNEAMYYWTQKQTNMNFFASPMDGLKTIIGLLNANRQAYLKTKETGISKLIKGFGFDVWNAIPGDSDEAKRNNLAKKYWWQMIQLLPSSYNQKRTVMMNYEVLANIYKSRKNHKLDEWKEVCKWIETLPYSELITGKMKGEQNEY